MMPPPPTPLSAATHPDPYLYYAQLAEARPLHWDGALGLWVAAGPEAVMAVLRCPQGRVRPLEEPVPRALVDSAAGEIFRHLVRMNDGPRHSLGKPTVTAALDPSEPTRVWDQAHRSAQALSEILRPAEPHGGLSSFLFQLPVHTLLHLLGVPEARTSDVGEDLASFVKCLAPGATAQHLDEGCTAAERLLATFHALLSDAPTGLLAGLGQGAPNAPAPDPSWIAANAVGLLSQSYEATAGLLANALLALRRQPELRSLKWREVLLATLRLDPPIQNTRRYLAEDVCLLGQTLHKGQGILVILASAPELAFGTGSHACPGEATALLIAGAGLDRLRMEGLDLDSLPHDPAYRPSLNSRIPVLN